MIEAYLPKAKRVTFPKRIPFRLLDGTPAAVLPYDKRGTWRATMQARTPQGWLDVMTDGYEYYTIENAKHPGPCTRKAVGESFQIPAAEFSLDGRSAALVGADGQPPCLERVPDLLIEMRHDLLQIYTLHAYERHQLHSLPREPRYRMHDTAGVYTPEWFPVHWLGAK